MAEGARYRELADADEARAEAEIEAEAEQATSEAEQAEVEQHARRTLYHLQRFLELSGRELPDNGRICPLCEIGLIGVDLQTDPSASRCATCEGQGRTLTGSLVPGNETRTCPACSGSGFEGAGSLPVVEVRPAEIPIPVVPFTPAAADARVV